MAQRLSFDERARVEAMSAAGVSVATAARCLGRHRSTVYRELRRGRRGGAYDAEAAQAAARWGLRVPRLLCSRLIRAGRVCSRAAQRGLVPARDLRGPSR